MTGWFCWGVPTEEEAKPVSEAISEEDFDPIVSVRTAESWENGDDNYEFANDVSPDCSVTDQEQFDEDAPVSPSDDVWGVVLSTSSQNEEMTSTVPDEILARYFIPFTVAENPRIVNEETLLVDKPTLYPIGEAIEASKITDIQKSVPHKMAAVTRPNKTERNPTEAIEPPRTSSTEVKPVAKQKTTEPEKVSPYRTIEVEAAMETVASWEASSPSNVKEDQKEAQQFNKEKPLLKSEVKKKCEEKESNPAAGAMKTPKTSKIMNSKSLLPTETEKVSSTRNTVSEKESNPLVEAKKTPGISNSNTLLSLKTTTEAEEVSTTGKDVNAPHKWKALNGKPEEENPPREAPPSPVFDCKWKALNGEPEEENSTCEAPLPTTLEPKIAKTEKNKRSEASTILWLEQSNSFLVLSSLGTMESREDDSCECDIEESRTVEGNSLVAGGVQSFTYSKKKVRFAEPHDQSITSSKKKVRFMEHHDDDVGNSQSDLDFDYGEWSSEEDDDVSVNSQSGKCRGCVEEDDDVSVDSQSGEFLGFVEEDDMSVDSQSGKYLGCACGGELFSGFRELVQAG